METRTWTENGTPVSKEKTVAFSGHRTNRIAKFTADREKLFREVAFDTFAAIESYCIKKGYDTFLSGMCEGFDLIAAEEVLNLKKRYPIYLRYGDGSGFQIRNREGTGFEVVARIEQRKGE